MPLLWYLEMLQVTMTVNRLMTRIVALHVVRLVDATLTRHAPLARWLKPTLVRAKSLVLATAAMAVHRLLALRIMLHAVSAVAASLDD